MAHFRHYIYGIAEQQEDEFLTTALSKDDAEDWASRHKKQFGERFSHYSIRLVDVEVCVVKK